MAPSASSRGVAGEVGASNREVQLEAQIRALQAQLAEARSAGPGIGGMADSAQATTFSATGAAGPPLRQSHLL